MCVPLLGKFRMSRNAAGQNGSLDACNIEGAIALCTEALAICDSLNLSGEIGARLQQVICSLEEKIEVIDAIPIVRES